MRGLIRLLTGRRNKEERMRTEARNGVAVTEVDHWLDRSESRLERLRREAEEARVAALETQARVMGRVDPGQEAESG
jgi:hypothetical protein